MNGVWFIGRVVRVEKVEKENTTYWKVRIASRSRSGDIYITAYSFTEGQPAHVGDTVFVEGELMAIPDGGFYVSANRMARLKRREEGGKGEKKEEGAGEKTEETKDGEKEKARENKGDEGSEGEDDEDLEDIEF